MGDSIPRSWGSLPQLNVPMVLSHTVAAASTTAIRTIVGNAIAAAASGAANQVGVRGLVTISGALDAASYLYGAQGKLAVTGTIDAAALWGCGVMAQLDCSAGTYTAGQLAGLWVDMGAAANASAKALAPDSISCIRVTCTPSGFKPLAILSAVANATYFMDLAVADGTPGWYDAETGATANCTGHLKIKLGGTDAYIRVYQSAS